MNSTLTSTVEKSGAKVKELCKTLCLDFKTKNLTESYIVEKDGKIYLRKDYGCTEELWLLENNAEFFKNNFKMANSERLGLKADEPIKNDFWKKVYHETVTVLIPITRKCNLNCEVCIACGNNWEEPSVKQIAKVAQKYRNKTIELTGGEPTLREDLPEIIKTIKKTKNKASIFTNGVRTADKDYLNKLVEAGLDEVILSFDSLNKDFVDEAKGGSFVLPLKFKTLKNLEEKNVCTKILFTYFPGCNEDSFRRLYKLAIKKAFIKNITAHTAYTFSGRFNLKISNVPTLSDVLDLVTSKTRLSQEVFLETRRSRDKIRKLLAKLLGGKADVLADDLCLSVIVDKNGEPVLNTQDLKIINSIAEGNVSKIKDLNKKTIKASLGFVMGGVNPLNFRNIVNAFGGTEVKVSLTRGPETFHTGNIFRTVIWDVMGNMISPAHMTAASF